MKKKITIAEFLELFLSLLQSGFSMACALQILIDKKETNEYAAKIIKDT